MRGAPIFVLLSLVALCARVAVSDSVELSGNVLEDWIEACTNSSRGWSLTKVIELCRGSSLHCPLQTIYFKCPADSAGAAWLKRRADIFVGGHGSQGGLQIRDAPATNPAPTARPLTPATTWNWWKTPEEILKEIEEIEIRSPDFAHASSSDNTLFDKVQDIEKRLQQTGALLRTAKNRLLKTAQRQLETERRSGSLTSSAAERIYKNLREAAFPHLRSPSNKESIVEQPHILPIRQAERRGVVDWVVKKLKPKCCKYRVRCPAKTRRSPNLSDTLSSFLGEVENHWGNVKEFFKGAKVSAYRKLCCEFDMPCPTGREKWSSCRPCLRLWQEACMRIVWSPSFASFSCHCPPCEVEFIFISLSTL